jgi:hypothetical protein
VDQNKLENFNKSQQEVLESMRVSRIILPVLIGVGAVAYLLWRQFDPAEFARIDWTVHTLFWILLAIALAVLRHVAYALSLIHI